MNTLIMGGITLLAGAFVFGVVVQFITRKQPRPSMPEITEAERQGAGENAMYAELGRVK